jgi:pimeloyl-ACP methyl ester carboxylesterase
MRVLSSHVYFKKAPVYYTVRGNGRAVIFIHGFLESKEIWDDFATKLAGRFKVICIDLPGHGESACISYVQKMEMMAGAVKAVLDALRLRRYYLVGHSMGGYVALAFAEQFGDSLSGICLFHSTALPDSEEKKRNRQRSIEAVKMDHTDFVTHFVERLFAPDNVSKCHKEISFARKIAQKTPKQAVIACLEGMKNRKNREIVLKFAPFPVLFITGKKDTAIDWQTVAPQTELCIKGQLLLLDNAGHMGFFEEPELTAKTLMRHASMSFRQTSI